MLSEVLRALNPQDGGVFVDATFGAGGYTRAILEAADCTVYAIDRDPEAFLRAQEMAKEFQGRLFPVQGRFGDMVSLLHQLGLVRVDGIVLDIGVSSMQIDEPARGFSFMREGPLDMRMGAEGISARDVVNTAPEKELADILFVYGEERASRRIAKRIVEQRPVETTTQLAAIVHSVLPMHGGIKTDTATRTFQALRIFVNDELGELERALDAAESLLKPDGRLVVVTFHSLEDSIVKKFLKTKAGKIAHGSRHLPPAAESAPPSFLLEDAGGLKPSAEEVAGNPRARSARLRWGIRAAAEGAAP